MSYLITYDRKNYIKLQSVSIVAGGFDVFYLPGGYQKKRKRPDTFSFSYNGKLPHGGEAVILDSTGALHFVLFTNVSVVDGETHYSGIITETGTPDKKQLDEVFSETA